MPSRAFAISVAAVAALAAVLAGGIATAQNYPTRPVTMIVPFPPGGATDAIARILNERFRAALGQTVIIENIGGADPNVRTRLAAMHQEVPPRQQQTAEGLAAYQKSEIEKWWPVIGIKAQ